MVTRLTLEGHLYEGIMWMRSYHLPQLFVSYCLGSLQTRLANFRSSFNFNCSPGCHSLSKALEMSNRIVYPQAPYEESLIKL